MGCDESSGRNPSEQSPQITFEELTGLKELRIRVAHDEPLGCVTIASEGGEYQLLIAPVAALDLALKLIGSVARLRGWPSHG